ncbi:MAG: aspartyl protease family protein [Steroidobacteraceae bacterium]
MSQVTVTPSDAAPAEPAPLQEITVSAPEPRYVAPTQRDRIGRIWAPVYLDGQGPFRLVLDTGANRSAVIPRVTEALGWRARAARPLRVRGVTGTAVVPAIRVGRMEIGDLLLAPVTLPVVPDVFGGADGVLGNEGLGDKRIVIDFRRDSISVRRSRREPPGPGFHTLPITFARDHLLVIEVYVGNVRTKAIIDTGAPDSLGNLALLEALKRRVATSSETDIQGVTLDIERGNRVRMPTIRMQGVMVRGAAMTVGDVQIFQHWNMTSAPALLLGMDVLGVLDRIIIDYRTRELHLLPRGG